jgi:hypothetical protein
MVASSNFFTYIFLEHKINQNVLNNDGTNWWIGHEFFMRIRLKSLWFCQSPWINFMNWIKNAKMQTSSCKALILSCKGRDFFALHFLSVYWCINNILLYFALYVFNFVFLFKSVVLKVEVKQTIISNRAVIIKILTFNLFFDCRSSNSSSFDLYFDSMVSISLCIHRFVDYTSYINFLLFSLV